jgi:hypothetical protein
MALRPRVYQYANSRKTGRNPAMPLSIKDEQTDALARRLAGVTGETLTVAVKEALRMKTDTAFIC